MGCSSSNPTADANLTTERLQPEEIAAPRRRLSVDRVEILTANEVPVNEPQELDQSLDFSGQAPTDKLLPAEDRAQTVPETQAVEKITEARRYSIGTMTDQGTKSFANKTIETIGGNKDLTNSGLGFTCRKGLKPESPNQDSWGVLEVDGDFSIYGVYDGHGQKGHDISNYVKDVMPKLIVAEQRFRTSEMKSMLVDIFRQTQELISAANTEKTLLAQMSGTTATVAILEHLTSKLTISHVADSTAVLATYKDSTRKELQARSLTRDHKPDLPDERDRIEKAGGRVVFDGYSNHRVYAKNARYPGLNMSRCLGDLLGHQDAGCSCIPEVSELTITPEDHMLLLCSDGVWEFITPQEAVDIVGGFGPESAMQAADKLAQESWDRWIKEESGTVVDDITVLLVFLQSHGMQSTSK